ncbi:hypothetical protein CEUSTIGMA_g9021.t1 [Chlamydomonas eustigma]|uniref:chloroplast protein-transporting ATPase n=1 Tax=Chlamydomonas eustigma TaxID=1157962 RepID=A0A250XEV8_9CHLO|nr:hypothetical protein CEUSTIGMA_g9021.t1 [Chlamydomonas eustigma]|eukprot:GAX81593.1 hypothetical protein CEUSTIGMA_g9021.t1 [Chlamydomonas eustigma]
MEYAVKQYLQHWLCMEYAAYELYKEGKQYIVRDKEVVLIDESTGRLRPITRWQGGLHQAVEAKEGVKIKQETQPTAQITFQVFFRFYSKLAGMTGTATPAAAEFFELYKLKVVSVPTNKPSARLDLPPRLYFEPGSKYRYLVSVVHQCWAQQRPLLIGTTSVRESETVLAVLHDYAHPRYSKYLDSVQMLNAKPEKVRVESEVIAQAGLPGSVTIATNMAGRGTDIILGGSPRGLTRLVLMRLVYRRLLADVGEAVSVPVMPLKYFDIYDSLTAPPTPTSSNPSSSISTTGSSNSGASFDSNSSLLDTEGVPLLASYPQASDFVRLPETLKLPQDLHSALLGSVMLAAAKRSAADAAAGSGLLSYDEVTELLGWVMDQAYEMRQEVVKRLRSKYNTDQLDQLEFSVCVAPIASQVAFEAENRWSSSSGTSSSSSLEQQSSRPLSSERHLTSSQRPDSGTNKSSTAGTGKEQAVHVAPGQGFTARTALLLWLWLEQQCARYGQSVRQAGGLLVVGTSIQESRRVELQLAGRAGRQGDPGQTIMLYDFMDPLIEVYGMGALSQILGQQSEDESSAPLHVDGVVVEGLVSGVRRPLESMHQMARLETKKYDEVIEEYRRSIYALRRLILQGTAQQRTQVIYMFIQIWVDRLVSELLDARKGPQVWSRPAVPKPTRRNGRQMAPSSSNAYISNPPKGGVNNRENGTAHTGSSTVAATEVGDFSKSQSELHGVQFQNGSLASSHPSNLVEFKTSAPVSEGSGEQPRPQEELVSPLEALLRRCFLLLSPEEETGTDGKKDVSKSTAFEFKEVKDGIAKDVTMQKVLSFFGAIKQPLQTAPVKDDSGRNGLSSPRSAAATTSQGGSAVMKLDLEDVPLLTPQQVYELVSYASGASNVLPWPAPPYRPTVKQALATATHVAIFGMDPTGQMQQQQQGRSASGAAPFGLWAGAGRSTASGGESSWGKLMVQRPAVQGRHSEKVAVIRNYLGVALLHAYEMRRLSMKRILMTQEVAAVDMDAEAQVWSQEQQTLLLWIDALWSCFLEDIERLKKAVYVKSYSQADPLNEFRIEANRAFLAMLDAYREAVVEKVMSPDFKVTIPIMREEEL